MIDLISEAGLPIGINDEGNTRLEFGDELKIESFKKRVIGEMKDVLVDKEQISEDTVIYRMYDGVYKDKDRGLFKNKKLRYDLTLMYPGKMGSEFIKTAGHYHSISDDHLLSYPELYEVLHGEVHFIIQKKGRCKGEIEDIVVLQGEKGQRIVVPPDYGHVAVNPGNEPLVLANWIAQDCKPDYAAISRYGGVAIFEKEVNGQPKFTVNNNYSSIPDLRIIRVDQYHTSLFDLDNKISLYSILLENPDTLDWLRYPSREINKFENYIGKEIGS